jgi:PAS domain S-box-containing protein
MSTDRAATPPAGGAGAGPLEGSGDAFLETLLAGAQLGIGFLDRDLRFVRLNEALAVPNGVAREDHLGRRLDEIWPDVPAVLMQRLGRLLETGESIDGFEFTTADGRRHTVGNYYPVWAPDGVVAGVGMLVADVTARRLAEQALRGSEHRLREMLSNARVIAVNMDTTGRITYCNPFLCELTGWAPEELIGAIWWERFSRPEDREGHRDIFLGRIDEGIVPLHGQNYLLTRSGEERMIIWDNTVLRDDSGELEGTTGIGHDVTAQMQFERALHALVGEQSALRRVATLVAADEPPDVVFQAVTREASKVLGVPSAVMLCYDSEADSARVVGHSSDRGDGGFPVGSRIPLQPGLAATQVRDTGMPSRVVDYSRIGGDVADSMGRQGYATSVAAPITVSGRLWGALVVAGTATEPLPPYTESRLPDFTELVGLALAGADARRELAASRARIVDAADRERRRLERNLHDGAQQRLVSLSVALRLAQNSIGSSPEMAQHLLAGAQEELHQALAELRELARGLHPAILTERGLGPAIQALADRLPIPAAVDIDVGERFPQATEIAAYYVVSEALANIVKYARAREVRVRLERVGDRLVVEVVDDGRGGADPAGGSGLRGLIDRVEAHGGTVTIESPPGAGTRIRADLAVTSDEEPGG